MPECAFHRGVETDVRCPECGRYICPKDMVDTPVGYKCRECGLSRKPKLGGVKPRQLALGALSALGAGVVLCLIYLFLPFQSFWISLLGGVGIAEATRRGAGGHRSWQFAVVAAVAAFAAGGVAALLGAASILGLILAPIAAAVYLSSGRW
ncbi:MAG: hypothetical protein AB2L09_09015 [Coriobacteriia bacterium]